MSVDMNLLIKTAYIIYTQLSMIIYTHLDNASLLASCLLSSFDKCLQISKCLKDLKGLAKGRKIRSKVRTRITNVSNKFFEILIHEYHSLTNIFNNNT